MRVVWTEPALDQMVTIRDYISQTSPEYAQRVVTALFDRSDQISALPRSGRIVPDYELDDVREVLEGPYRLIYLIKATSIEVLAVIHTSRNALPGED